MKSDSERNFLRKLWSADAFKCLAYMLGVFAVLWAARWVCHWSGLQFMVVDIVICLLELAAVLISFLGTAYLVFVFGELFEVYDADSLRDPSLLANAMLGVGYAFAAIIKVGPLVPGLLKDLRDGTALPVADALAFLAGCSAVQLLDLGVAMAFCLYSALHIWATGRIALERWKEKRKSIT